MTSPRQPAPAHAWVHNPCSWSTYKMVAKQQAGLRGRGEPALGPDTTSGHALHQHHLGLSKEPFSLSGAPGDVTQVLPGPGRGPGHRCPVSQTKQVALPGLAASGFSPLARQCRQPSPGAGKNRAAGAQAGAKAQATMNIQLQGAGRRWQAHAWPAGSRMPHPFPAPCCAFPGTP